MSGSPSTKTGAPPLSSHLMATIAHLEANYPVHSWRAGSLPIWPLVRTRWVFAEWARHYTETRARPAGSAVAGRLRGLLTGPRDAARIARADPEGRDVGPDARDLVFLSDGASFGRLGSKWVERFCDPIIRQGRLKGLSSGLLTPSQLHKHPRFSPSRLVQPAIDRANLLGALIARLRPPRLELEAQSQVAEWLERQGYSSAFVQRPKIASDGVRLQALAAFYRRQLARIRPRLAFVVGYYGLEPMAFVLACREAGVLVTDIQHGVQGPMHPAYAMWPQPPHAGRHALLPDRFWVWSGWEREVIDQWARGTQHAPVVGGNPWDEVWQEGSDWPGVAAALEGAGRLLQRAGGLPVVLVTLQYGLSHEEQLGPLLALVRSTTSRFRFWIRLHPAMLERRNEVRALLPGDGHCELDEPTDLPLPALLKHAAVHLTHSSTTVIEAAQAGLRSVVTSAYGAELFVQLLAAGVARLETGDAHALAAALGELLAAGRTSLSNATRVAPVLQQLLDEAGSTAKATNA
jgi:hypothetical protein